MHARMHTNVPFWYIQSNICDQCTLKTFSEIAPTKTKFKTSF